MEGKKLLYAHEACQRAAFGFHYMNPSANHLQLLHIGWEKVDTPDYRWDGMTRRGRRYSIFQFTLSGRGAFRSADTVYSVGKNEGFLCTVPSDHCYYFPDDSPHWEFLYVVVRGGDAVNHWSELEGKLGSVVSFPDSAKAVEAMSRLYADIYRDPQMDKFLISARLYELVMELHRLAEGSNAAAREHYPPPVRAAIRLMQDRCASDLSLDELAACAGLTKYHFCRQFQKTTGLPPIQYLRKVRVEKAAWLLRHTGKPVSEVARESGFDGSNYFIKVFRSLVGVTPVDYRLGRTIRPVHFLRIEK